VERPSPLCMKGTKTDDKFSTCSPAWIILPVFFIIKDQLVLNKSSIECDRARLGE
jgi:hypothetical protein